MPVAFSSLANALARNPAQFYLRVVLLGAMVTLLYAKVAMYFGNIVPLGLMLGYASDMFDDYFKLILAFPGGEFVQSTGQLGLHWFTPELPEENPYIKCAKLFADGSSIYVHGMPLVTLFSVISVKVMRALGGEAGFMLTCFGIAAYWCRIAFRWSETREEGWLWFLVGALSYPMMFMVARGNVYAGFTGVLIMHSMLLASRRQAPILAAIVLAIAVNIRPQAILFAVPLFLFQWPHIKRALPIFCLAGGAISVASMALAHHLYPSYTPQTFLASMNNYYRFFVVGDYGLQNGSSLFGALRFYFGYHRGLDTVAMVPGFVFVVAGIWFWVKQRISDAVFLFLIVAAYTLSASVIADYHLFVFILPLMVSAWQKTLNGTLDRLAIVASCLILLPKNFAFYSDISYQVVLNPLILLIAAGAVICLVQRGTNAWLSPRVAQVPA